MHSAAHTGAARALSKLGACSRSQAVAAIQAGRVTLNGRPIRNPETPVHVGRDCLTLDGRAVVAAAKVYLMLNKPRGLVTTAADERGRATVFDCLRTPEAPPLPHLGPVGRLDQASEGLLLFTNDTAWAEAITAPESHCRKTYHVQIDRLADDTLLRALEAGIIDAGERLYAQRAHLLRSGEKHCWLEIVLDEGRNRQIRRLLQAHGIEVLRLVRVAIGPLTLGDLPKGAWRPLTPAEVAALTPQRAATPRPAQSRRPR